MTAGGPRSAFDRHAASYDQDCMRGLRLSGEHRAYFARGRLQWLLEWWRESGLADPRVVVDYGCGTGEGTLLLAETFPDAQVQGFDASAACVEGARRLAAPSRVTFRQADDPSTVAEAQLIHVSGVLHHVAPAARPALVQRLAHRLAPTGVLAIFENNPLNPGTRLVMSRIPFDRDAVPLRASETRALLAAAGLRIVRLHSLFYFPRWLRLLRPLERRLRRVPLGAQYGVIAVRD